MKLSALASSLVVGTLAFAAGCIDLSTDPASDLDSGAELSATSQSLSVTNWSPPSYTSQSYRSATVANLGGVTYKVESGRCGVWTCGDSDEANELWWSKRNVDGTWTAKQRISGQYSGYRVSLAPFGGYLYMVHSGYGSGATNVWLSRFNPTTQTWSTNYQLSYYSKGGPPAIAAFNGLLYLAGVDPSTNQVWTATMTTGEVFSARQIRGTEISTSRVSLAVAGNSYWPSRLYLTHRHGISTNVVYSSFDGATWSPWQYIAGPSGEALQSNEPVFGGYNGYLHLVFKRPDSNYVWWTYLNGSSWPAPITINNLTTTYDPSVGNSTNGLSVVTTSNDTWNGVIESRNVYVSTYTAPFIEL